MGQAWDQLHGQMAYRTCSFYALFLQVAGSSGHICVRSSYLYEFIKNAAVLGKWPRPPVNYRMDSLCLVFHPGVQKGVVLNPKGGGVGFKKVLGPN